MTTLRPAPDRVPDPAPDAAPSWRPRSELEVLGQQLRAIDSFTRARRAREAAAQATARTREMRLDASRQLEVLRRQHEALVTRSTEQLRASGQLLAATAEPRIVLAHRSEWFLRQVAECVEEHGVRVVARLDNGADVVGVLVAEQPDLVLVEDALAMARGDVVVREARAWSASTLVGVQAAGEDRFGSLLDAGAAAVFSRRTPPRDVATSMLALLAAG